jgi:pyridoxamine 5'-phosphate oxidase
MASSPPRRAGSNAATAKAADPIRKLFRLLQRARRLPMREPEAMTLATSGPRGRPSARIVLLRGLDQRGLAFFTNYRSRKGRELGRRPFAALVFYWPGLGQQVRVEGRVTRLSGEESDVYFASRPRAARLAAWASDQSTAIPDRDTLRRRYASVQARFRGRDVPRPPHWGGYRLVPLAFEFWRSGSHRLHDRLRYARRARGWKVTRLSP